MFSNLSQKRYRNKGPFRLLEATAAAAAARDTKNAAAEGRDLVRRRRLGRMGFLLRLAPRGGLSQRATIKHTQRC
jgi:hypothetical protein